MPIKINFCSAQFFFIFPSYKNLSKKCEILKKVWVKVKRNCEWSVKILIFYFFCICRIQGFSREINVHMNFTPRSEIRIRWYAGASKSTQPTKFIYDGRASNWFTYLSFSKKEMHSQFSSCPEPTTTYSERISGRFPISWKI